MTLDPTRFQPDLRIRSNIVGKFLNVYRTTIKDRRGHLIFLAGESGSGRTATLQALDQLLHHESQKPIVVAGHFSSGEYKPWKTNTSKQSISKEITEIITKIIPIAAKATDPLTKSILLFANQVIQASISASNLVKKLIQKNQPSSNSPSSLKALLRSAASDGPIVCLLDDLDQAETTWWTDFIISFSSEIAELPILLVVTLEGPVDLRAQSDIEPDLWDVARRLVQKSRAEWWSLRPLDRAAISTWLGCADPKLVDQLYNITGGNPRWVMMLWQEWREQEKVRLTQLNSQWEISPGQEMPLGTIKDIFEERLKNLLRFSPHQKNETTIHLLAFAALEGQDFTADALSQVFEWNRDELIDFLDDFLVKDDARPEGLLIEKGCVIVEAPGRRSRELWRYTFSSELFWQTLNRYGLTQEERQKLSLTLARALINLYEPKERQIARTLTKLFTLGRDKERAAHYQRVSDFITSTEVIRLQALSIITTQKNDWEDWEYRRATEFLLEAVGQMLGHYPFSETLAVVDAAYEMALHTQILLHQADALHYKGNLNHGLGNFQMACQFAEAGLALFIQIGEQRRIVNSWILLGSIDMDSGDYESAQQKIQTALELASHIGDLKAEAACFTNLAVIDRLQGRYDLAREKLQKALNLAERLGDLQVQEGVLHNLGIIAINQKDYDRARQEFQKALEISQELGEVLNEAHNLSNLGTIDEFQGDNGSGRTKYENALEIIEQLGYVAGQIPYLGNLASIDQRDGNYKSALINLKRALKIAQQIADPREEAYMFLKLGLLAEKLGAIKGSIHLLLVSGKLFASLNHFELRNVEREIQTLTSQNNYSNDQIEDMYQEVIDTYKKNRGWDWVNRAFGENFENSI